MNTLELFERREVLKGEIAKLRSDLKAVNDQLEAAYLPMARSQLALDGKDFGTAHVQFGNQRLKVVVGKKVTWDQNKLRDALESMSTENARHYGKLTFAVEERKYTTAPPSIRAVLEECRTTEVGTVTIEIED